MKKSEFLKIKESSWDSRIGRRSLLEQKTRDDVALIIRRQRRRVQKWKEKSKSLVEKEIKLRKELLNLEIDSVSKVLEWWDNPTLQDLRFLEWLSASELSKIGIYYTHWMRWISHSYTSWEIFEHPYYPKYVFLYEIFKDISWIDEKIKSELKEKAKAEVRELVCNEIKWDTFLYSRWRETLMHIFEYIPQKIIANKLRWTWNLWTDSNVDVLWRHIGWFTDLDEDYKKEIKREYNRKNGIVDPDDVEEQEVKTEDDTNTGEEESWGESEREDVKAFLRIMEKKEKDSKRFDEWLEEEWWL